MLQLGPILTAQRLDTPRTLRLRMIRGAAHSLHATHSQRGVQHNEAHHVQHKESHYVCVAQGITLRVAQRITFYTRMCYTFVVLLQYSSNEMVRNIVELE
jgi:hypothetical protein